MLCAIARLSGPDRDRLRAVQAAALALGYAPTPLYGHVTLAVCAHGDEDAFTAGCREALNGLAPFAVRYERIEILSQTSIIVATPAKSGAMLAAHDILSARFGDWLDAFTRGEAWRPHTTLFHHPDADLAPVCRAMAARFEPFTARIDRVELSRVLPKGYAIVGSIDLKPRQSAPGKEESP